MAASISSLSHPIVKHLVRLRTNKRYRHEIGTAVVVGETLVRELSPVKRLLSTSPSPIEAQEKLIVTEGIIKKITGLPSPEPIVAEVALPQEADLSSTTRIIVLDHIADPGNLGTLLRTALALGFEGAVLINGVDPFNDKAIAAAKGASFRLPLSYASIETLPHTRYIADIQGTPITDCRFEVPCALILGNESHGPSIESGTSITIPITSMESLNVAAAGAIIMHEIQRHA